MAELRSTNVWGALRAHDGGVELFHATPYIDFHYGNSANDYTARIIEDTSGSLNVIGNLKINGTAVSKNGHTHGKLYNGSNSIVATGTTNTSGVYTLVPDEVKVALGTSSDRFYNVNTEKINASGAVTFGSTLSIGGITTISARINPKSDASVSLGSSSLKFANVYCKNASMNTSDLNKKRDLSSIDDRYIELFDLIEPCTYYFKNGDRVHTGFIAQYVEEAMEKVGLTAEELGFFGKDIQMKYFYDEDGNYIGEEEVYDEDGNPVYIYSLRYTEYIAIMTEKIKRLEKKYNSKIEELDERMKELEEKMEA